VSKAETPVLLGTDKAGAKGEATPEFVAFTLG